jgi:hypothetical protein
MKKSSSRAIKDMQIKTTLRGQATLPQSEWPSPRGRGEKELSYTVGENVNLCSHYRNQHGDYSKNLIIELPKDPVIPFLGM